MGLVTCQQQNVYYFDTSIKEKTLDKGDLLWKAANINFFYYKNNGAAVYVGSFLKEHNPLFSVGKFWRKKIN